MGGEPCATGSLAFTMPYKTAELRARALVAFTLSMAARDPEVASLLLQISEEFEEEACTREQNLLSAFEEGWPAVPAN